jgi:regulatory protein
MNITKVAKKGTNNVEIHFDDGQTLILSYEIFLKNGLRRNDEVSESHFLFLKTENEKFQIKQKSYNYLARRLHSERELRLKLLKNRYNTDLIDEALEELKKLNYLDDEKFAYEFVEEKSKRAWGKNKIKSALISRGVQSKTISKILDEEIDRTSEYEKAFELANKKLRILSGRNLETIKLKQKINAFLVSKGFDFDVIREVLDSLEFQKDDEHNLG